MRKLSNKPSIKISLMKNMWQNIWARSNWMKLILNCSFCSKNKLLLMEKSSPYRLFTNFSTFLPQYKKPYSKKLIHLSIICLIISNNARRLRFGSLIVKFFLYSHQKTSLIYHSGSTQIFSIRKINRKSFNLNKDNLL